MELFGGINYGLIIYYNNWWNTFEKLLQTIEWWVLYKVF